MTTMTKTCRSRRSAHIRVAVAITIALSAVVGGLVPPVGAQAGESARRDEVRRQQAEVARELDVLTASNAELEQAVADLDALVRAQEARVNDARRAADDARANATALRVDIAEDEEREADLEGTVRLRAVELYVDPSTSESGVDFLTDDDPSISVRRRVLSEVVSGDERDLVDQLRGVRAQLEADRAEAERAAGEADAAAAIAEDERAGLVLARNDQARVRQSLEERIAGFRAEADNLAAEDAEITAALVQREADLKRQQQEAEAIRQQQEAQARAARETPSAPTTTRPGPSTPSTQPPSTQPPTAPPTRTGRLVWPVSGPVTSGFGPRWGSMHTGIDISAAEGTPIVAADGGTVISAGSNGDYGLMVMIDHGGGLVTGYAHQSRLGVSAGQQIAQGSIIGYVGSTGRSTGNHLHFETRVNGVAQDPLNFL